MNFLISPILLSKRDSREQRPWPNADALGGCNEHEADRFVENLRGVSFLELVWVKQFFS